MKVGKWPNGLTAGVRSIELKIIAVLADFKIGVLIFNITSSTLYTKQKNIQYISSIKH